MTVSKFDDTSQRNKVKKEENLVWQKDRWGDEQKQKERDTYKWNDLHTKKKEMKL